MRSERSSGSFSSALFIENIRRFWLLALAGTVLYFLCAPFSMLSELDGMRVSLVRELLNHHNVGFIFFDVLMPLAAAVAVFSYLNSTGTLSTDVTSDPTGAQVCITSGINRIGGVENVWFLSEDKNTKQRYLHLVSNMGALRQTIEINPATHLAKASVIAACGGSASYIYCVDGGKLYAYGWANNNEIEVALPGLSSNIAYVTNQWFWIAGFGDTTYNFDNLIVGTQSGDSYTLYFFDKLVGGVPTAEAYRTVSGTGKVRYIRRATPVAVSNLIMTSPTAMRAMPIFPTSE